MLQSFSFAGRLAREDPPGRDVAVNAPAFVPENNDQINIVKTVFPGFHSSAAAGNLLVAYATSSHTGNITLTDISGETCANSQDLTFLLAIFYT
jgi:hypothetical protein